MWITGVTEIVEAMNLGKPAYCRQVGGITWMELSEGSPIDLDVFEYWVGDNHPTLPASVDPDYPAHMRPKLLQVLSEARKRAEVNRASPPSTQDAEKESESELLAYLERNMFNLGRFCEWPCGPACWHVYSTDRNAYDLVTRRIIASGETPKEAISKAMKERP